MKVSVFIHRHMEMRLSRGPMEGGARKKGLRDEKKNERIYIKEREKGAERMEFEWRPDRANK